MEARSAAVTSLVVVASIVTYAASLSIWVKREALDSDNWANGSAAMLRDNEVRAAVSTYLVDQLYLHVDVAKVVRRGLPANLGALADPIAAAGRQTAVQGTDQLLGTPQLQRTWAAANRRAHRLVVDFLDGKLRALRPSSEEVVLDLHALLDQVAIDEGLPRKIVAHLAPNDGRIVLVRAGQIQTAQRATRAIRIFSDVFVAVAVALYGLAIWLAGAGRRRVTILNAGIAVLFVGLLDIATRRLAGDWIVDALVRNPSFRAAGLRAWSIETGSLESFGVGLVLYGACIALAAWIAGPGVRAARLRELVRPALAANPRIGYAAVTFTLLVLAVAGAFGNGRGVPLLVLVALGYAAAEALRRRAGAEGKSPPGSR